METITKETHIIYMTYDTTTGEYYIGLRSWRGDKEPPGYFGSYKKDSDWRPNKKNLVRITLAEYPDRETLKDEEVEWIRPHLGKPLCKNRHNRRLACDYWGKPGPWLGKNLYSETRKKLSESHKGIVPWNKGKTNVFSPETIEKMKKPKPREAIEKMRQARLGTKHTEETRAKMRQPKSQETRAKMSEAHKGKPSHWKGKSQIPSQMVECPYCNESVKARGLVPHKKYCKKNPNRL